MRCLEGAAAGLASWQCELWATLGRASPGFDPELAVPSPLESMTDDAPGQGSSYGDPVFHYSVSLAPGALLGPLGLTPGLRSLAGN